MPYINFTQYLLPHGRQRQISTEVPDKIAKIAHNIEDSGFRFETEILRNKNVALYISYKDYSVAIKICKNGPVVSKSICEMIEEFNIEDGYRQYQEWNGLTNEDISY